MSVLNKLASALGRNDEVPNQELAKEIIAKKDKAAVKELAEGLRHKNKAIQSDCIKVLYEIGEHSPALISAHAAIFLDLLNSKNNRLQWGAMTALDAITNEAPDVIYGNLVQILDAAYQGSVITKDHAINILIKLCRFDDYRESAFILLLNQLKIAATNQLPMYAENALAIINKDNKEAFAEVLNSRMDEIEQESKRARVEKVLKKVNKI